MTDSTLQEREAFEKWVASGHRYGEHYVTDYAWRAWQAARAQPAPAAGVVERVAQETEDDCVPCSLAMLARVSRQHVLDKVGNLYVPGKGLSHTWRALNALGFSSDEFIGFATARDATDYEMDVTLHLTWNRRAMISVPSLNHKGGAHMVYVEGNRVFDPSNKEQYTEWSELRPYEVIIFNDAALPAPSVGEDELRQMIFDALPDNIDVDVPYCTQAENFAERVAASLIAAGVIKGV